MKKERIEPMCDELTEAMHATITISDAKDREFRVWAALEIVNASGSTYSIEEALDLVKVTMVDYEKYKDTYLSGDEFTDEMHATFTVNKAKSSLSKSALRFGWHTSRNRQRTEHQEKSKN